MRYKTPFILCLLLVFVIGGCRTTTRSPETEALLRAVRDGHADAVEELLKTPGIDVNATDGNGDTALLIAARFGHDHVTRVLLAAGANMKVRDKDGKTPLMVATAGGHEEVVAALQQAGARE
jgi:ankyrin repeat protein